MDTFAPPPLPSQRASTPPKKSNVGCIIAGCSFAFIGFLALLAVGGYFVYEEYKKSRDVVPTAGGYFTFDFEPGDKPFLAIGQADVIAADEWPEAIGDFSLGDVAVESGEYYATPIGKGSYIHPERHLTATAVVMPYTGMDGFTDLVNGSVDLEFPRGGAEVALFAELPVFHHKDKPSAKFTAFALREHAVLLKMEGLDGRIPEAEELTDLAQLFFEALSGGGSAETDVVTPYAAGTTVTADFGYDEGNVRELELSPGPLFDDGIAWPEPDPSEDSFALARADIPLPEIFEGFTAEAAVYSALNLDANVSRPIEAVFFPLVEGESLDLLFAKVLGAFADTEGRVNYEGFVAFFVSDEDTPVREVAVQILSSGERIMALSAFSNGILVCLPEVASADEPADSLPPLIELTDNFVQVFAVGCYDVGKE